MNIKLPKSLRPSTLRSKNVTISGYDYEIQLRCDLCGEEWWVERTECGYVVRDYWKCPNGCNATKGRLIDDGWGAQHPNELTAGVYSGYTKRMVVKPDGEFEIEKESPIH